MAVGGTDKVFTGSANGKQSYNGQKDWGCLENTSLMLKAPAWALNYIS